jgi:iron complex transport system substrate-binding protein
MASSVGRLAPLLHRWAGILSALYLAACQQQPPAVAAAPQRIVSLSPATTEMLFAVGCGKQVVLRDRASDYPPAVRALAAVDGLQPGVEAIHAVRPQLVLGNYLPPPLTAHLRTQGVPWLLLDPHNIDDVAALLLRVGERCGQPQRAADVAERFRAELRALRQATAALPAPSVYVEVDATDPQHPFAVGGSGFGHDLVVTAGGKNVFATRPEPWFAVSTEAVLAADPEIIVLVDADGTGNPQSPATIAARPGWGGLRAVRNHRIVSVAADVFSRPGPRLVQGATALAHALHRGRSLPGQHPTSGGTAAQQP